MTDRVRELLDFDLALLGSIVGGRRHPGLEAADVRFPDLRTVTGSIRFVGFDEAGRGALAGPVAVGCVHIDLGEGGSASECVREAVASALGGLDDSKRLTPRRREAVYEAIVSVAHWGIGYASASEIDRSGIIFGCRLAARRAYVGLGAAADVGLFDRGLSLVSRGATTRLPEIQLTRGDARSLHVAAASVVAKVERDAVMDRLDGRFPGYGLARHKGYGTAAHREAIRRLGPSIVHRRSFCTRIESAESQSH